jgi:hypothetical protein
VSRADRLNELRKVRRRQTRQTRTWVSSGEGTDEVAAPLAGPPGRGAQAPIAQALPVGETLTVLGDPQVADGGGTPLVVSRRAPGIRGGGQVDFEMPTSRFEPGTFAYYTVTVSFDWQGYTGGGWVAVERSGVELERCQAAFGTRFEHTFHVGVIDPADEEYVEVLASPVGDPGLDGFDEAPDGQTLTGLRITWELVDVPRVPVEPDEGVQPWAWYRGDDLDGNDGDPVSAWSDRTGNGRDLTAIQPQYDAPVVADDAIDGQRGLKLGATWPPQELWSGEYGDYHMVDGMTIVTVSVPKDDIWAGPGFVFRSLTTAAGNLSHTWIDGYVYLWSHHDGWVEYFDEFDEGPKVLAFFIPTATAPWITVDGVEPAGKDSRPPSAPPQPGEHWVLAGLEPLCELLVFDSLIDPGVTPVDFGADGVQTLNGYLAGRYPSLFGGV